MQVYGMPHSGPWLMFHSRLCDLRPLCLSLCVLHCLYIFLVTELTAYSVTPVSVILILPLMLSGMLAGLSPELTT